MGYVGLALCKHDCGPKPFLFRMPRSQGLRVGDRVVVDTAKGEDLATVLIADSYVDEDGKECQMLLKIVGVKKVSELRRVLKKVMLKDLNYEEDEE